MNYTWKQFNLKKFFIRRKFDLGFLILGAIFGVFFNWSLIEIIFFLVFIWSILDPIQSRWLTLPALAFFSLTPVLLLLGYDKRAEEFAIYTYYFLVMIAIRAIIEMRQEGIKRLDL